VVRFPLNCMLGGENGLHIWDLGYTTVSPQLLLQDPMTFDWCNQWPFFQPQIVLCVENSNWALFTYGICTFAVELLYTRQSPRHCPVPSARGAHMGALSVAEDRYRVSPFTMIRSLARKPFYQSGGPLLIIYTKGVFVIHDKLGLNAGRILYSCPFCFHMMQSHFSSRMLFWFRELVR